MHRLYLMIFAVLLAACSREAPAPRDTGPSEFQKQLQTQLIQAKPGEKIEIELLRGGQVRKLSHSVEDS